MQCSKCNFENPSDAKFCGECGQKFSADKRSQETVSDPISDPVSDDEKFAKIQKYLPKGIAEKILAQKGRIEGERRQVPATIEDVIMARVDSLPEEVKYLLQVSSVIGREFRHKLINKLIPLSEQELLSHLSALKTRNFCMKEGFIRSQPMYSNMP